MSQKDTPFLRRPLENFSVMQPGQTFILNADDIKMRQTSQNRSHNRVVKVLVCKETNSVVHDFED